MNFGLGSTIPLQFEGCSNNLTIWTSSWCLSAGNLARYENPQVKSYPASFMQEFTNVVVVGAVDLDGVPALLAGSAARESLSSRIQ